LRDHEGGTAVARMIPASDTFVTQIDELHVYRALRDDPNTSDWVVLHGLPLYDHPTQVEGEIDFLALIPGRAAVVLEVKGWGSRGIVPQPVNSNAWCLGEEQKRNPYTQVRGQAEWLRGRLQYLAGLERQTPVHSVVVWTRLRGEQLSSSDTRDVPPERTITADAIERDGIGAAVVASLARWEQSLGEKVRGGAHKLGPVLRGLCSPSPNQADIETIARSLSPRFAASFDRAAGDSIIDLVLDRLDEQQASVLAEAGLESSERLLINGPAGSGKTAIAIDVARRHAKAGMRVLYLCSTDLLADWLASQVEPIPPALRITSVGRLVGRLAGTTDTGLGPFREWDPKWLAAIKAGPQPVYDELIVDEGQTLLGDPYDVRCVRLLDTQLVGGMENGRWRVFSDWMQTFSPKEASAAAHSPNERCETHPERSSLGVLDSLATAGVFEGQVPIFTLKTAYRSSADVVDVVRRVGDGEPGLAGGALFHGAEPSAERRSTEGLDDEPAFQIDYYENPADQARLLARYLGYATGDLGYRQDDVVVLSGAKPGRIPCAAEVTEARWSDVLAPFGLAPAADSIRYGRIEEFEGMDARVVVVTDLLREYRQDEEMSNLRLGWPAHDDWVAASVSLYRAFSRSRQLAVLLLPADLRLWLYEHWLVDYENYEFGATAPWWIDGVPSGAGLRCVNGPDGEILLLDAAGRSKPVPKVVGPMCLHLELRHRWSATFDVMAWEAYWGKMLPVSGWRGTLPRREGDQPPRPPGFLLKT
jgi:hypothetical protein